jgi:histidine triad (HIT) family protein
MATVFSKIIKGEIPSYKIAEDRDYFAFLDISPLAKGHTLVIPKKEVDYLFDLDDQLYSGLMLFSKKVALAIKEVVPCLRIGVTVIGIEVPHVHIHLIPINRVADINFSMPKKNFPPDEMKALAEKISESYNRMAAAV